MFNSEISWLIKKGRRSMEREQGFIQQHSSQGFICLVVTVFCRYLCVLYPGACGCVWRMRKANSGVSVFVWALLHCAVHGNVNMCLFCFCFYLGILIKPKKRKGGRSAMLLCAKFCSSVRSCHVLSGTEWKKHCEGKLCSTGVMPWVVLAACSGPVCV